MPVISHTASLADVLAFRFSPFADRLKEQNVKEANVDCEMVYVPKAIVDRLKVGFSSSLKNEEPLLRPHLDSDAGVLDGDLGECRLKTIVIRTICRADHQLQNRMAFA